MNSSTTPTSLEAILRQLADDVLMEAEISGTCSGYRIADIKKAEAAIQALIPAKRPVKPFDPLHDNFDEVIERTIAKTHNNVIDTIQHNFTGQRDDGKKETL